MGLWDQFQRPTGRQGRIVAAKMNRGHFELTTWGLTHVTIEPSHVLLDVGCGGGKTINRLAQQVPQGKAYGIDYSPDMVTYAKKLNKKFIDQN
ncbi:MAG TPA: class I SAM-dependent methyltransferase, partial [Candidatus Acidoferrales bacterium]|nr:class I SAM-dependent methyltransferase [Candidatus Acidoferrales bacterium]